METQSTVFENNEMDERKQRYNDTLETLSESSVRRHFDAFVDIDWDAPENAIIPDDERWILGSEDNLGSHPWYQSLPKEQQIEVGKYRLAHTVKVGSQFEMALIAGVMASNIQLHNGDPAFRYSMHETTEETHHIQMFQEFVNRTGVDTKGAPAWFRHVVPLIATASSKLPAAFWVGVLAGEEPVDHAQKMMLRSDSEMHPLLQNIMAIHVAEEARHISFAHMYLKEKVPKMSRAQQLGLTIAYPVIMRTLADVIMRPSKEALADMGIPKDVAKEIWWDSKDGKKFLRDLFPDARMLADELGLRGKIGRAAWKLMKIDGRSSRFRNEPNREDQYVIDPSLSRSGERSAAAL